MKGNYPGLILKLRPRLVGLALTLRDELLESQSVVLPQGEADVPQHQQNQLNVLLCEGADQKFEDVEDEARVHHLEVVEVADDGDQVVALLVFSWVLVNLVKLPHDRLQKMCSHLENDY